MPAGKHKEKRGTSKILLLTTIGVTSVYTKTGASFSSWGVGEKTVKKG